MHVKKKHNFINYYFYYKQIVIIIVLILESFKSDIKFHKLCLNVYFINRNHVGK